jgi:primosomal protein N' (replication factor Y)
MSVLPSVVKVSVEVALDREFDYAVPESLRASVAVGMQVEVPFGRRTVRGYVVGLADHSDIPTLKPLRRLIGEKPLVAPAILELARWMADYYVAPVESAIRTVLPSAVRRAGAGFKEKLHVQPDAMAHDEQARAALRKRSPRRADVLDRLLREREMFLGDLLAAAGTTAPTVRKLETEGFLRIGRRAELRSPTSEGRTSLLPTTPLQLMPQQVEALDLVRRSMDTLDPPVVLLFGVTGSGKTEVYLQAIQYGLDRGQGAIVLVPEISLTPQTVERFQGRFGDRIAVLHSSLSSGERHDEWHRIHDGSARIVIGARSALFAPVHDLGLIVVDEEHEHTYKQEESPRYHARDVAVMRGHREKVSVLLGTATPSLESMHNARSGKYGLAILPHRVDHRKMPVVRVVDMRAEAQREGKIFVLSRDLMNAIQDRLDRREQTILFLNRRGFATSLTCPLCGYVATCSNCSVAMTYHRQHHRLVCHICGDVRPLPQTCPNPDCRDPAFRYAGMGTQRVEDVIAKVFPRAKVTRMDADTTTGKGSHARILNAFRAGEIDVLVGTQMIAKGLHFPNVTLVGVINADSSLHMPDFRAGERTFQLLTQVAGRAGRGDVMGEVIVQTFTPFHPSVQAARQLDYELFYDQEIEFRRELAYPPFAHLACITLSGPQEELVALTARTLARRLQPLRGPGGGSGRSAPGPRRPRQGQGQIPLPTHAPRPHRHLHCPPPQVHHYRIPLAQNRSVHHRYGRPLPDVDTLPPRELGSGHWPLVSGRPASTLRRSRCGRVARLQTGVHRSGKAQNSRHAAVSGCRPERPGPLAGKVAAASRRCSPVALSGRMTAPVGREQRRDSSGGTPLAL